MVQKCMQINDELMGKLFDIMKHDGFEPNLKNIGDWFRDTIRNQHKQLVEIKAIELPGIIVEGGQIVN